MGRAIRRKAMGPEPLEGEGTDSPGRSAPVSSRSEVLGTAQKNKVINLPR